jgi:pimeloyl-ACP methyl ester carboxylesterase
MKGGFVEIEGLRVHHVHGGKGSPPVLFVHGLGSAGYLEWRHNLGAVAGAHRVFAPDLPGFGRSERPDAGYGVPLFARVIHEYIRRHRIRPVLVGASMGGRVALEVALEHPESVRKLVLVNSLGVVRPSVQPFYPLVLVPRLGEGLLGLVREGLHRLPPNVIRRIVRRYLGARGRAIDDAYLSGMREMYADESYVRAYARTVRALASPTAIRGSNALVERLAVSGLPVLMVWGARDPLFPVERARAVHRRLPGAWLAVMDDAGHAPQAEQPETFNRILEEFLAA